VLEPVLHGRDEAQILCDVLLAYPPRRNYLTGRERQRAAEDAFEHEDTLGMVAKGAVPKIRHEALRLVEPIVQPLIILHRAAPLAHAAQGMMKWMGHNCVGLQVCFHFHRFVLIILIIVVEVPGELFAHYTKWHI
jgi:hypothetical protein